jgi:hypothetical protein
VYFATVKVTVPVVIEQEDGLLTGVPDIVQLVSPAAKFVKVAVTSVPGIPATELSMTVGGGTACARNAVSAVTNSAMRRISRVTA